MNMMTQDTEPVTSPIAFAVGDRVVALRGSGKPEKICLIVNKTVLTVGAIDAIGEVIIGTKGGNGRDHCWWWPDIDLRKATADEIATAGGAA